MGFRVVYYSDTTLPASQVAAAIHLNLLPLYQVPEKRQLIRSLAGLKISDNGVPLWLGRDESGNEVFALHFGRAWSLGLQTVGYILSVHHNPLEWKFFKVSLKLKFPFRVWFFILKHLKLAKLEQECTGGEIQKQYWEIATIVRKTKELSKPDG